MVVVIKEGLEQLAKMMKVAPEFHKEGELTYSNADFTPIREAEVRHSKLTVTTLQSFVDYVKSLPTGDDRGPVPVGKPQYPALIHVSDHEHVSLVSRPWGREKRREWYCQADYTILKGTSFSTDIFHNLTDFIIMTQSRFKKTDDRDQLLEFIGTVRLEAGQEVKDHGTHQDTTVKAGIALVEEAKIPNPVILRPYRTFPEIEQPSSTYIFRVENNETKVECGLFEADGGTWKNQAIEDIKKWLREQDLGLPVI